MSSGVNSNTILSLPVDGSIMSLQHQIQKVADKIGKVEAEINKVEIKVESSDFKNEEEKQYWYKKVEQLRDKEKQLREELARKEIQLQQQQQQSTLIGSTTAIGADANVIASANAIWHQIQQIPEDPNLYSDPSHRIELPFPFPDKKPSDRFDLHDPSSYACTFTYMGRKRFQHILNELPIPEVERINSWRARHPTTASSKNSTSDGLSSGSCIFASSSALTTSPSPLSSPNPPSTFFPPIPANAASRSNEMFIYGTIGWGKSHLLAAMVCLLMRKGRKIVYVPDCKIMINDPVKYFRSALLLTFASKPDIQRHVASLDTTEKIVRFCDQFPDLTYIIDQFNALEDDTKDSNVKANVRQMINSATFSRALVKAASANNHTARVIHDKQLNMNIQTLFGGMDQDETNHWYQHHSCLLSDGSCLTNTTVNAATSSTTASSTTIQNNSMQDVSVPVDSDVLLDLRRRLEDTTGCIPLYLKCFVGCTPQTFEEIWCTKFAVEKRVRRVYNHLFQFHEDMKKLRGELDWRSHIRLLRTFLLGGPPDSDYYDHRYMYEDEKSLGRIACGLARDCLVSVVRQLDGDSHFVDGAFLSNIKTTRNPSMRGFLIEQACLTYIRNSGLLLPNGIGLLKPDAVIYFDAGSEETALNASSRTPCVLYIPRPFNYKAIDAIIRYVTFGKNAAGQEIVTNVLLVPIQVTISASHKPSPSSFYPRHHVWLKDIDNSVPCQHIFVWLRREHQDSISHSEHQRPTRAQLGILPPFEEVTVTFNTLSGDLHVNTSPPRHQSQSYRDDAYPPIPFNISNSLNDASAASTSTSASIADTSSAMDIDPSSRIHVPTAAIASHLPTAATAAATASTTAATASPIIGVSSTTNDLTEASSSSPNNNEPPSKRPRLRN